MIRAHSQGSDRLASPAGPNDGQSTTAQATDGHRGVHSETGAVRGEHPGRSATPSSRSPAWRGWSSRSRTWTAPSGSRRLRLHRRRPDARGAACCAAGGRHGVPGGPARAAGPGSSGPRSRRRHGKTSTGWPGRRPAPRAPRTRRRARRPAAPTRAGSPSASCTASRSCPRCRSGSPAALELRRAAPARVNATQRPARRAGARSSGSVTWSLGTTRFRPALDWYLRHLGLIVSDFLYLDGQRERGPAMAFIRCDRGSEPDRPPHPGDGCWQPQTGLRALRLRGDRPGRGGRRRGVPARARLPARRGGSAGTSRAARSSTTGATRTG